MMMSPTTLGFLMALLCGTVSEDQKLMQIDCMRKTLGLTAISKTDSASAMIRHYDNKGLVAMGIVSPHTNIDNVCLWKGVHCVRGEVIEIQWKNRQIDICFFWLPPTLRRLNISNRPVSGELITSRLPKALRDCAVVECALNVCPELRTLPNRIENFDVSRNNLSGKVRISHLPSSIVTIDLSGNQFKKVFVWNACLPKKLRYIQVEGKLDNPRIIGLDGPPDKRIRCHRTMSLVDLSDEDETL